MPHRANRDQDWKSTAEKTSEFCERCGENVSWDGHTPGCREEDADRPRTTTRDQARAADATRPNRTRTVKRSLLALVFGDRGRRR